MAPKHRQNEQKTGSPSASQEQVKVQKATGRGQHHPSGVSSFAPQWHRRRKLTVLYYRSCGMSVRDIAQRVDIRPRDVRRYLDEMLSSGGV